MRRGEARRLPVLQRISRSRDAAAAAAIVLLDMLVVLDILAVMLAMVSSRRARELRHRGRFVSGRPGAVRHGRHSL